MSASGVVWCGMPMVFVVPKIIHWRRCLSRTQHKYTNSHETHECCSAKGLVFRSSDRSIAHNTIQECTVASVGAVCGAVFVSSQTFRIFTWQIHSTFVDFFYFFHPCWLASSDIFRHHYVDDVCHRHSHSSGTLAKMVCNGKHLDRFTAQGKSFIVKRCSEESILCILLCDVLTLYIYLLSSDPYMAWLPNEQHFCDAIRSWTIVNRAPSHQLPTEDSVSHTLVLAHWAIANVRDRIRWVWRLAIASYVERAAI